MIHIYREGEEKKAGLSIGWVVGPVIQFRFNTHENRHIWYARYSTRVNKFTFYHTFWTRKEELKGAIHNAKVRLINSESAHYILVHPLRRENGGNYVDDFDCYL